MLGLLLPILPAEICWQMAEPRILLVVGDDLDTFAGKVSWR